MVIFSHIGHILHNHFATFHCGLSFLKFLTFSWWLLHKYRASLADSILGLIIEVMKGGILSNRSNSSSSTTFLILTIHHFSGITNLSLFLLCLKHGTLELCVLLTWNPPRSWTDTVDPSLSGFTIASCVDSLLCYRLIKRPKSILQDRSKI
jgi:hypothetical protein